jgi:hypothetical protein
MTAAWASVARAKHTVNARIIINVRRRFLSIRRSLILDNRHLFEKTIGHFKELTLSGQLSAKTRAGCRESPLQHSGHGSSTEGRSRAERGPGAAYSRS